MAANGENPLQQTRRTGPLAGIRVLEVAEFVTGPLVGLLLAQMGADVVKVERPPKGDAFRPFGLVHQGVGAGWENVNHGKRSVLLDLKSPEGRAAFLALAGRADVLVQNWRPHVADELGLGDAVLVTKNPRLVRLVISAFGASGPLSEQPAFDAIVQARSGMVRPAEPAGKPVPHPGYPIDKATGLYGTVSVLAALFNRERTGEGSRIDLSMLDTAAFHNFVDLFHDEVFVASDVTLRTARPSVVRTKGGHIVVAPVTGRQLGRSLEAVGHPEWKERLKATKHPTELSDLFFELMETETQHLATEDLMARFAEHDVPAAPVLDAAGHFEDPQVGRNALYAVVDGDGVGPIRRVRYPGVFDGQPLPLTESAPGLGSSDVTSIWPTDG